LFEQRGSLGLGGVGAGAFEQQVDAVIGPVDVFRVLGRVESDALAVDDDAVFAIGLDAGAEAAVRGVVLQQVGVRCQIAGGVDGDDVEFILQTLFVNGAQRAATDTTKPLIATLIAM
jgi:hypothetical protein